MQTREIILAGRHLRYGQVEGEGRPLLLIGGIGMVLESAHAPAAEFARRGFNCLSLELPGSGSARPARLRDYADLLAQWLDYLQISRLPVMGVSWGGALAQEFTRRHPQRTSHLILVSTTAGMAMLPGTPKALLSFLRPGLYKKPDTTGAPARVSVDFLRMGWQMLASAGWTSIHWLHRLEQPALVISGSCDRLVRPANARLLANRLSNAQLEFIDNAGHLCAYTHAEQIASLVSCFCDSNSGADGARTTR